MSLAIRRLTTDCLSPPRHAALRPVVDRFARERLAGDLGAHLGPSLDREPEVIRVRRLAVTLEIPASKFGEEALSKAWVLAFSRALFEALAYPDGMGPAQVRRYASRAAYLAVAIRELLPGTGTVSWQFTAFAAHHGTAAAAVVSLAEREPETLAQVLHELAASGFLDALLAQLDELTLERLFRVLAIRGGAEPRPLQLLMVVADAAASLSQVRGWKLSAHRQALRVWVSMSASGSRLTPRQVRLALQALRAIIENPSWLIRLITPFGLPPDVGALLDTVAAELAAPESGTSLPTRSSARNRLREAIEKLAGTHLAAVLPQSAPQLSIYSETAGVLLLIPIIDRLDWWRRMDAAGVPRHARPRVFAFLMAGIAFALGVPESDATAALLGGNTGDFDVAGLKAFCEKTSPQGFVEPLDLPPEAAISWDTFFLAAAHLLAQTFASRVRGFRNASFDAIRKNFFVRPGHIVVEERRLAVILEPHPWNVALRLSGMDDDVNCADWLDGRRLQFTLEGL